MAIRTALALFALLLPLAVVAGPAVADDAAEEAAEEAKEQLEEQRDALAAFRGHDAHPAECARLRRQIAHFQGMQKRAVALGNPMWAQRTGDHADLLRGLQAMRCPSDIPVDTTGEAFKQLVKLAAKAAVTYFTFGAAGFMF